MPLAWTTQKSEIRAAVLAVQKTGKRVGVVPTMGNLHEGHASLIRAARQECDFVVVTLFVNPIQFNQAADLAAYPRTPDQDRALCEREGADALFAPSVETMYPPGHTTRVQVVGVEEPLCGRDRPGHFVGVATVVSKLFHIIPADLAYFGLKDYQQCRVIDRLVRDLDFPVQLRFRETVREPDGLAMSSRNAYLTKEERAEADCLYQALQLARKAVEAGVRDPKAIRRKMLELVESRPRAQVDYIEIVDPDVLAAVDSISGPVLVALAVRIGKARLIDNAVINPR